MIKHDLKRSHLSLEETFTHTGSGLIQRRLIGTVDPGRALLFWGPLDEPPGGMAPARHAVEAGGLEEGIDRHPEALQRGRSLGRRSPPGVRRLRRRPGPLGRTPLRRRAR
jgi:hypothetical protein